MDFLDVNQYLILNLDSRDQVFFDMPRAKRGACQKIRLRILPAGFGIRRASVHVWNSTVPNIVLIYVKFR